MKTSICIAAMLITGNAAAGSACDKPKNDFDGLYCLNKIYQESDKELNANYKALTTQLDKAGRIRLKRTQLAWMQDRNKDCARHDDDGFFVNLQCATDTTIDRAQFLQDRIRECKSAGCLNSKL